MNFEFETEIKDYNYKQALAGLVRHADYVLTSTPCPLRSVVTYLLAEGDVTSYEAGMEGITLVHKRHPQTLVMDNEGNAGYFVVFLYQAPLVEISSMMLSNQGTSRSFMTDIPQVSFPQTKTSQSKPKKKKAKKKIATQTDEGTGSGAGVSSADKVIDSLSERNNGSILKSTEPHVISSNVDSLRELANDILGKQCSQLTNNISWITKMLQEPTALEQAAIDNMIDKLVLRTEITEICDSSSWKYCMDHHRGKCANKIHFEKVIESHTDVSLGDCAYLDSCFKGKLCRFVHYRIKVPSDSARVGDQITKSASQNQSLPQLLNANILKLNLKLLGNDFKAMIIDPPWEIHTKPGEENGCSDEDIANLDIASLQTSGVVFLWVTGRVLEFGRKCLEKWGYTHIEELIWLKTNQLCRTICTGRTGHWLNHTKEHVLVGTKGQNATIGLQLDTDVLVSHALGKSQKPVELYSIIDRLVGPHGKKLELFGRPSNQREGWLTVGNQMHTSKIYDPELRQRLGLS